MAHASSLRCKSPAFCIICHWLLSGYRQPKLQYVSDLRKIIARIREGYSNNYYLVADKFMSSSSALLYTGIALQVNVIGEQASSTQESKEKELIVHW